DTATGELETVPILQRVSESEVAERPLLPSFLYLPGPHELPPGALTLPWKREPDYLVGEFARSQGARVPSRQVLSAKSWLAHRQADPTEDLLPWGSPKEVPRLSPVEASARYLEHLRQSWDHRWPDAPMALQSIVLTVPASFDELARELTLEAARRAGLEHLLLLEEPQAAFYAWLSRGNRPPEDDLILVCDIGGGTTDFTLIRSTGGQLERVAVGDHLMLGGDNLDIAFSYAVEPLLESKLDLLQWGVLRNECRRAKELLLGEDPPDSARIAVPGSGARLVASLLTAEVDRPDVESLVLDGFFPRVPFDEPLLEDKRSGLREWGLPYAADPALPRHLSSFLRRHGAEVPGKVLFNGGACRPPAIRERIRSILEDWRGAPVEELVNPESDLAVARGAAHYAWLRRKGRTRIQGGIARSYYVAVSGAQDTLALCVIPRNQAEGSEVRLKEPVLHLTVDAPVRFPLFTSSVRPLDRPGALVGANSEDLVALPPLETVLTGGGSAREVPVTLSAMVTEVGTLEIYLGGAKDDGRYRLAFNLRGGRLASSGLGVPPEVLDPARELIQQAFDAKPGALRADSLRPKSLIGRLESLLRCGRDGWTSALLRALWEPLSEVRRRRRADAEHEAAWLYLVGFCLRPGIGMPLDAWRVEQTAELYAAWMQFPRAARVRAQWWIAWRRMAAGLRRERQEEVWRSFAPELVPGRKHFKSKLSEAPKGQESLELLRLAVSLEKLPLSEKELLGRTLVEKFRGHKEDFWRLG
ncbi:MAG: Hsp70 family protein, partial [Candidatus Eremiobacterota bacterium]